MYEVSSDLVLAELQAHLTTALEDNFHTGASFIAVPEGISIDAVIGDIPACRPAMMWDTTSRAKPGVVVVRGDPFRAMLPVLSIDRTALVHDMQRYMDRFPKSRDVTLIDSLMTSIQAAKPQLVTNTPDCKMNTRVLDRVTSQRDFSAFLTSDYFTIARDFLTFIAPKAQPEHRHVIFVLSCYHPVIHTRLFPGHKVYGVDFLSDGERWYATQKPYELIASRLGALVDETNIFDVRGVEYKFSPVTLTLYTTQLREAKEKTSRIIETIRVRMYEHGAVFLTRSNDLTQTIQMYQLGRSLANQTHTVARNNTVTIFSPVRRYEPRDPDIELTEYSWPSEQD